jgi:hypothetical protein
VVKISRLMTVFLSAGTQRASRGNIRLELERGRLLVFPQVVSHRVMSQRLQPFVTQHRHVHAETATYLNRSPSIARLYRAFAQRNVYATKVEVHHGLPAAALPGRAAVFSSQCVICALSSGPRPRPGR